MQDWAIKHLWIMRVGLAFTLLTFVYGNGLGAAFGAFEDQMKDHLKQAGTAVLQEKYAGDGAKLGEVTAKSWTYFKRAHLHANGLGASSLAMILLLAFLVAGDRIKAATAILLGAGSLGYSVFWLLAGLRAPALGGTGPAKASLEWLAVPSAGACILGLGIVCVLFLMTAFGRRSSPA